MMWHRLRTSYGLRLRQLEILPGVGSIPTFIRKPIGTALRALGRRLDGLDSRAACAAVQLVEGKTMLHPDTLTALYQLAIECKGAVLELGAFMGGATIVMAKAFQESGNASPIIAVEVGGTRESDVMPSSDILSDLRANLSASNVANRVTLLPGWSNVVADQVRATLGHAKIGLLVIDADGAVERDFAIYRSLLADGAAVVIDDYVVEYENVKSDMIFAWVRRMVDDGILKQSAVLPFGTWFGTYSGS